MASDPDGSKGPLFIPKRFGWGWSLNFKRPVSWIILIFLIAGPVALNFWIRHHHTH